MKRLSILTTALIVAGFLSACNEVEETFPSITFEGGGVPSLSFGGEGGDRTVSFNSAIEWTASVDGGADTWLTLGQREGPAGDAMLNVSAAANTEYDGRSASFTIISKSPSKTVSKTIMVSQSQKNGLMLDRYSESVDASGGQFSVRVTSNVSVNVGIAERWIHRVETKSLASTEVHFSVDANDSREPRDGIIRFSGPTSDMECTFKVLQNGSSDPEGDAFLTYSEASGWYSYSSPRQYANQFGVWKICSYSDGRSTTGFQIESGICSYIGTPAFDGPIASLTVNSVKEYTGTLYLCTGCGGPDPEGILEEIRCSGRNHTITLSQPYEGPVYVRASERIGIESVQVFLVPPTPPVDNTFTRSCSAPGTYDLSDPDNPEQTLSYVEFSDQISYGNIPGGRSFRIQNILAGRFASFEIDTRSRNPGTSCTLKKTVFGSPDEVFDVIIDKVGDGRMWLEDKSKGKGFIIVL